ncbi:MAG TPA: hypothetical protein EYH14_02370 [Euryarchaeota archaeon]|nr:hypothetical protein [Euryarchaeota archaeon]
MGLTVERPLGVTILAIYNFIVGANMLLVGIVGLAVNPLVTTLFIEYDLAQNSNLFAAVITTLVYGLVLVVVSWGLWTGKAWAWWLEVAISVLSLLSAFKPDLLSALSGAIVLWYLSRPHVKEYFGVQTEFST